MYFIYIEICEYNSFLIKCSDLYNMISNIHFIGLRGEIWDCLSIPPVEYL